MTSTEFESLQIELGEARSELLTTKRELEEMKSRAEVAEAGVAQARKNAEAYIEEFKRAALEAQKLIENLGKQLAAGDALRNRLAKVTDALAKADALILAMDSKSDTLEQRRAEYAQSKLHLQTLDG